MGSDSNVLGLAGGAEGTSWEGCSLSGSWLEWSCEEGHLADACKSTPRLESSKLLSYYLSSGSTLISSGPGLASCQPQQQDRKTHNSLPQLLCRDLPLQGRASQDKHKLGEHLPADPSPVVCPWGKMGCWLSPTSFMSLLPSPLNLPPNSSRGILALRHCQTTSFLCTPSLGPSSCLHQLFSFIMAMKAAYGEATWANDCTRCRGTEHLGS